MSPRSGNPFPILLARCIAVSAMLVLFGFAASPARAQQCTATATAMTFGAISTVDNMTHDTTATVTLSCTGPREQVVQYCPYVSGGYNPGASGPRYINLNAQRMAFDVYRNAARTQRYANGVVIGSGVGASFRLGVNGSGSVTITLYGRIAAGQQALPTGGYVSAFTPGSQVAYAGGRDLATPVNCADVGTRSLTPSYMLNVSATNQASCTLAASNMSFGSVATLDTIRDAMGGVSVTCSAGATFNIGMNGGANGGTGGTNRRMASGAGHITYGLYRDAGRSQPWYTDANGMLSSTGTGANQNLPIYGRVPAQPTPAAGNYTDAVIVTITY